MIYDYLIWCPAYGQEEKDARKISAPDVYSAMQVWLKQNHRLSQDYSISITHRPVVYVRHSDGVTHFRVSAEQEARHFATRIKEK